MTSPKSIALVRSSTLGMSFVAGALCLMSAPAHSQTGHVVAAVDPVATYRAENRPPVNSETVSCRQLKDDVQRAGGLSILSEPKRWPETFYGPEVPQCDPWSRPMFSYVKTNDGACGVGYICAPRITGGR